MPRTQGGHRAIAHGRPRTQAAARSRVRRAQRVEKRGNVNFTVLVLVIIATTVVVTLAMFETLSMLMGS